MALTIKQVIKAKAPQFEADPRLDTFIEMAELMTSQTVFGDRYNLAVGLRVCHNLALEELRGATNPTESSGTAQPGRIASEREGDLSRSYDVSSLTEKYADLANTAYGLELIDLINASTFGPRTRAMDSKQGSTGDGFTFGTEAGSAGA